VFWWFSTLALASPHVEVRSSTAWAQDRVLSDPHMAQEQGLVVTLESDDAWTALVLELELGLAWTEEGSGNAHWTRQQVGVWVDGVRYDLLGTLEAGGVLNDGGSFRAERPQDWSLERGSVPHEVVLVFAVPRTDGAMELELGGVRVPVEGPKPREGERISQIGDLEVLAARIGGPRELTGGPVGGVAIRPMAPGGVFLSADLAFTPKWADGRARLDPSDFSVTYTDGAWATCALVGAEGDALPRRISLERGEDDAWKQVELTCWFAVSRDIQDFMVGYLGEPLARGRVEGAVPAEGRRSDRARRRGAGRGR